MERFKFEIKELFRNKKLIEEALSYSNDKLTQYIVNKRKEQLYQASGCLMLQLKKDGRCPKCTLIIPCNHYSKKFEDKLLNDAVSTPESECSFNSLVSHHRNFKKERKRLKLMEKLQNYKEKKLNSELLELEEKEKQNKLDIYKKKDEEEKRKKYYEKQKLKLIEYKKEKERLWTESSECTSRNTCKSVIIKRRKNNSKPTAFKAKLEEIDYILDSCFKKKM